MKLLRSVVAVARARWAWSLVGAVVLSLVVWSYGDLVRIGEARPLEDPVARLLVVLAAALAWGGWNLFAQARARRANEALVAALAEPAARPSEPGAAELAELARRFARELDRLRLRRGRLGRRGRRRWLYELPWYAMIGPPGVGKSTALAQSGLRLRSGQIRELRGAGGTRHCDWVFTDEAVLLDTAGRWVTHESDPEGDQAAWLGFLDLLRKQRPRQPLNGVIVAVAAGDLLEGRAAEQADRIRARLQEVEGRLGLRLPVYLLVSKADLVAGFEPFFDDLTEAGREQVWGYTFDHRPGRPDEMDLTALRQALAGLVARLDRRLPDRLAAEPDVGRRALAFGFPARVAGLAEEIVRFVERCFLPGADERGAWLRGVYLASGTQAGAPIDRLAAAVAGTIGAPPPRSPASAVAGGRDRSFFLRRLLEDVVFGEASLVWRDPARERRERLVRGAALASLAAVAALVLAGWGWSYAGNRERHFALEGELARWARDAAPLARNQLTPADADFTAVLPLLDRLADLRDGLGQADPVSLVLGLSQRATHGAQLAAAYRGALADLLLPRLVLAAERVLAARLREPDVLIDGLKVYLSLAAGARVDAALLEDWFAVDAQARSSGAAAVASSRRHVAALAAALPELEAAARPTLDARLLAEARAALERVPLAARAYRALVAHPEVAALPGWRLTEHAGPSAPAVLVRRSGRPLGAEVPAIFTRDGFHLVVLPLLDGVARETHAENWVLGGRATPDAPEAELRRLRADMLRLYYDDAIAAWEGLLRDVTLAPMGTLTQAVEATKALSGPSSPLKLLVQAVVRETRLTVPPQPSQPASGGRPAGAVAAAVATAASRVDGRMRRLAPLLAPGAAAAEAPAGVPGAPVEARFAHLRRLVEQVDGAPPALDEALAALATVHARLAEAAASPNPGEAFARAGGAGGAALGQAAQRLPEPLRSMLGGAARGADDIGKSGALRQLNAVWQAEVLPHCERALHGRYPFSRAAATDAAPDDVARVLGPNGLVDAFVKGPLAGFVDTARQPWRDRQEIGLRQDALNRLARARRISTALFPGGSGPRASFKLEPLRLDERAALATLELEGRELRYGHGPREPSPFSWPGTSGGAGLARLTISPVGGGTPAQSERRGPWALLRLLEGRSRQLATDAFEVSLSAGPHELRLRLTADSVENPFSPDLLTGFACPEAL